MSIKVMKFVNAYKCLARALAHTALALKAKVELGRNHANWVQIGLVDDSFITDVPTEEEKEEKYTVQKPQSPPPCPHHYVAYIYLTFGVSDTSATNKNSLTRKHIRGYTAALVLYPPQDKRKAIIKFSRQVIFHAHPILILFPFDLRETTSRWMIIRAPDCSLLMSRWRKNFTRCQMVLVYLFGGKHFYRIILYFQMIRSFRAFLFNARFGATRRSKNERLLKILLQVGTSELSVVGERIIFPKRLCWICNIK